MESNILVKDQGMTSGESNIFCIDRGEVGNSMEERGETAGRIVCFSHLPKKGADYKKYLNFSQLATEEFTIMFNT